MHAEVWVTAFGTVEGGVWALLTPRRLQTCEHFYMCRDAEQQQGLHSEVVFERLRLACSLNGHKSL